MTSDFKQLFESSTSLTDLALKLGYKKYSTGKISGTAFREIKRKCYENGLRYEDLSNRRSIEKYDKDLTEVVPKSSSFLEVIEKIGLPINSGSVHEKVRRRIIFLNLNTDHFTSKSWSKGKNRLTDIRLHLQAQKIEPPWEEAFRMGSKTKNSSLLKRLVAFGKREYKCAICGLSSWNNKPIRLRLDHIDGDCNNSVENNLRLLCPNCDSQEDTFCRGNRKRDGKKQWWQNLAPVAQSV